MPNPIDRCSNCGGELVKDGAPHDNVDAVGRRCADCGEKAESGSL